MSKRFPFAKRNIEALSPHDPERPNREAEYSDAECIGLKLRAVKEEGGNLTPEQFRERHTDNPNFLKVVCLDSG